MLKLASITVCLVAILFVDPGLAKNLEVGARQPGDQLVKLEVIEKEAYLIEKREDEETYHVPKDNVITMVRSIDTVKDDTGASVEVLGGGPGTDYVKLKFKSKRFHGVYHRLEIYAKPR